MTRFVGSILVTLVLIAFAPSGGLANSQTRACTISAYTGRAVEYGQNETITLELLRKSYPSASSARSAGDSFLNSDIAKDRFDEIYTDHSEDKLALKNHMVVYASVNFERSLGEGFGYWVDGSTLYILAVTKYAEVGLPFATSAHIMEAGDLIIRSKTDNLGAALNDNRYLGTTWTETRELILGC